MPVVIIALVVLSHLKPISNFFLFLCWLDLTGKGGFKLSAIQ